MTSTREDLLTSTANGQSPDRSPALSTPPTPRKAGEFFAGIGLVRLALESQGWQVAFANDIDPKKAKMYRDNWPAPDHLLVGDVHAIHASEIPTCELFTASFPCNDLSIAGKKEGLSGKGSSAFWGLIRILRDLQDRRPRFVLIENVVGFLQSRSGRDFDQALTALNELEYAVDAVILNAKHWTPQSRPRLFVAACRDTGRTRMTVPTPNEIRPGALIRFMATHPRIRWDIAELPPPPSARVRLEEVLERLPEDNPHWWNEERTAYFMNQLSGRHAAIAKEIISAGEVGFATAFRRVRNGRSMAELRTDGLAGCLRTPRGGSGRQILFEGGMGKRRVRLLTARECARLQGVPESYKIEAPLNQALFGFGDAVCVPAVAWLIEQRVNPWFETK